MKRILTTTILAAFALTACSQPDNTPVAQNWNNSSPQVTNNINCEPQEVNGQLVVPVECSNQNSIEYEDKHYTTNNHYHTTGDNGANTALAVAGGAAAGVAGKMAYDKYKANKQNNPTAKTVTTNNARLNAPTQVPPSRSVDLSKQSFKPSTAKPSYTYKSSYTSSSSKRSFKSKSKRR